jgi:hypothetical protein
MAVFIAMSGNTHRLTQKQKMPVELTAGVHFQDVHASGD